MKTRLLFAWLLFAFCMSAQAQTSELECRLFAQDGKAWKIQVGGIKENVYGNQIDGDTLINGEIWKKVYNYVGSPNFDYTYYAAIRDVNKKVYAIAKGSTKPRLLYNFDLKVDNMLKCGIEGNAFGCLLDAGEKLDTLLGFPFVTYLKVERIDTIKSCGLEHRIFILSMLDAFQNYYRNSEGVIIGNVIWVEGIGSGAGPFSPWMPLPPHDSFFQRCYINRTSIFDYSNFYETDTPNAVSIPQQSPETKFLFDLQGRRLSGKPARGIYIEGGKKVRISE